MMTLTCAVPAENILGEGPIWDPRQQVLYWVDIFSLYLHSFKPETKTLQSWPMPDLLTSIALNKSGGLVGTLRHGFVSIDLPSGTVKKLESIFPDTEMRLRCNDGKCDPQGRYWVGTMDTEVQAPLGALFCRDPLGKISQIDQGFTIANGLGWSPDLHTMYFTETITRTIFQYDFHAETGAVSNRRIFATVPEDAGVPDGLTVDSHGYVWSAHWDGWRITRYDPQGHIDQVISLPIQRPTNCCFGGKDLSILYITSARFGLNETDLAKGPAAGSIFALQTTVTGLSETSYFEQETVYTS